MISYIFRHVKHFFKFFWRILAEKVADSTETQLHANIVQLKMRLLLKIT